MKVGTYIRHYLYKNRGERIYRYGIVIKIVYYSPSKFANVLWHASPHYTLHKSPYLETIKINLLEVVSEP